MSWLKMFFLRDVTKSNVRFFVYWQLVWASLMYLFHCLTIVFEHIEDPQPAWGTFAFLSLAVLALVAFFMKPRWPKVSFALFTVARLPPYLLLLTVLFVSLRQISLS